MRVRERERESLCMNVYTFTCLQQEEANQEERLAYISLHINLHLRRRLDFGRNVQPSERSISHMVEVTPSPIGETWSFAFVDSKRMYEKYKV